MDSAQRWVYTAVIFLILGLLVFIFRTPLINQQPHEFDSISFDGALHAQKIKVELLGLVNQPFFSVAGQRMLVDGEEIQVFEYQDGTMARLEAATIAPDGSMIGTTTINWIATPHFYQKGKLLVVYIGDNAATQAILSSFLEEETTAASRMPSIDPYACIKNSNCVVKDVRNCCGEYLRCVNKEYTPNSTAVMEECKRTNTASLCGSPEITGCACLANTCISLQNGDIV